MALTFDLLHPTCVTTSIYRIMCLPGLVKIRRIVREISWRKRFYDLFRRRVTLTFDLLIPTVHRFMSLPREPLCANLHQNRFTRFQTTVSTVLVMEEWTDGWTKRRKDECYRLNHAIVVKLYHSYAQFFRNVRLSHRRIATFWRVVTFLIIAFHSYYYL